MKDYDMHGHPEGTVPLECPACDGAGMASQLLILNPYTDLTEVVITPTDEAVELADLLNQNGIRSVLMNWEGAA